MTQGSNNKDMVKLIKQIKTWPDWRVEESTKAGWKVYSPDGSTPLSIAHGPRNVNRQRRNVIAALRRRGAPL